MENSDKFYSFVMSGVGLPVEVQATSRQEKVPFIIKMTGGAFRKIFLEFEN